MARPLEGARSGRAAALPAAALVLATLAAPAPGSAQTPQRRASRPPATGLSAATPRPNGADPRFAALTYRPVGPNRGGRVTAVAGHAKQPGTFYMGATGGGVWKTTDYGVTWVPISDGQIATGSIGAIRVAASDPNVVYVGTGSEAIRSNVIVGKGVYRSADAGKTWTHAGLANVGQIGAIEVDPRNADVAYVAALGDPFGRSPDRGVYRTRDGGKSWQKVLFVADSVGAVDLAMNPSSPDEIYAGMWRAERKPWTIISGARVGGVYKTTDGGDHWTQLTNGLPRGLRGKLSIDVARSNPKVVYVLIEAEPSEAGVYRSDDAGATWTRQGNQAGILRRPFYYTYLNVDPKNPDRVWVNNETFWLSTDAGKTFRAVSTPHGDNHGMWIDPENPDLFIQANDGGANVTTNGGRTWSSQYNQPTGEFYQVAVDDQTPYRLYGAQQDNTTVITPSLPPDANGFDLAEQLWRQGPGCETGPIAPKPGDAGVVYGACKGIFSRMDLRSGQEQTYAVGAQSLYGHNPKDLIYRFQRVSPLHVSPNDPKTIYFGSQYVHRTRDEGHSWERISPDLTANEPSKQAVPGEPITRDVTGEEYYSVVYAIQESPKEKGVIWAGANDGPIHVTRDDGRTWTNVTPKGLLPGGRVQTVEPSPNTPGKAYVAVLRYLLDDWRPYIYRTTDYGKTWTLLTPGTNGIPADWPTHVVREDPEKPGLLYAGTEFGMFYSRDDGGTWQPFQQNLPATPVTDIQVRHGDLVLSTMGRGFWIMDDLSSLRQWSDAVAQAPAHLFTPREAVRMRWGSVGGEAAAPRFPPPGASLDYWLGASPGDVSLEIVRADGKVVRSFSSAAQATSPTPAAGGGRRGRPPAALPAHPGLNRFVWDLAWTGPAAGAARGGRGPLVAPGDYTVRLTAGGQALTRPLRVIEDPRVLAAGVTLADLQEQEALSLEVRDALSSAIRLRDQVRTALKAAGADAARTGTLRALDARLSTAEGISYPQPMLIDQIAYLYGQITDADKKVGQDAKERFAQLKAELEAAKSSAAVTTN